MVVVAAVVILFPASIIYHSRNKKHHHDNRSDWLKLEIKKLKKNKKVLQPISE